MFEALTLKRLGLYFNPIVLVNTNDFYTPLQRFMLRMIEQRFMNPEHAQMWTLVDSPGDVLAAIRNAPTWSDDARSHAVVRG